MAKKSETVTEPVKAFMYMGPSFHGLIQHGSIYSGRRSEVVAKLKFVTDKYPDVERLIVDTDDLIEVKRQLNAGEGSIAAANRRLRAAKK